MAARHKPLFYRRKRRVMPGIVVLLSLTGFVAWMMSRSSGPLVGFMAELPSLYQWIPAAIMWAILLVMITIAMFGPRRED